MQVVLQDLRYAFRQIIRNPGFSITAVLSLTLGIGATVAVYSILYDTDFTPGRMPASSGSATSGSRTMPGMKEPGTSQVRRFDNCVRPTL
jgi:hypothetical protein